ncbi:hypothetical protein KEJ15_06515 [Candidatus Bathyarchaeota archaeon]|nr:hypothetical protein [Candidatus Bathyarchaeota archaeon]
MNNLSTNGGKIFLKKGYYDGTIVITRNGLIIEGEGSSFSSPPQWSQPLALYGTVIKPRSGQNGILISGSNISGIVIKNLGIWFETSPTGDGIATDGGNYFNVEDLLIESVNILNHDGNKHAINLENFLETTVTHVNSAGGGLLCLYANWDNFHAGDAVFSNMYGRISKAMDSDPNGAKGFPFIVARNGTRGNCWINDIVFNSILMNNPTTQTDEDFYGVVIWSGRNLVFNHLHFGGVDHGYSYRWIDIGDSYCVTFISPYFWSYEEGYIKSQHTNYKVTWVNPTIAGSASVVSDGNQTDLWINPAIYGSISNDTIAGFENLEGNSGWAIISAGSYNVTVQARFFSPYDSVSLTIISSSALQSGESLVVSSWDYTNNRFTVSCLDRLAASTSIMFFWKVIHSAG